MSGYEPKYTGSVTKYVYIDSPTVTASDLALRAYEISGGAMIKETCFGLMITGKEGEVNHIIAVLRTIDPAHIFVKARGFPPGDPRRCRANLGGARPGFFGLEYEALVLPYVSRGLEKVENRDVKAVGPPIKTRAAPKLSVYALKKLIDAQEP
jgi:putative methanogenesis marker protein 6